MDDEATGREGAAWPPVGWLRRFRSILRSGPRTRNLTLVALLNAGAAGSEYAARLVTTFIVRPLVVAALGSFGFGAWQVIQSTVSYAAPLGGKPTHALKWTLATMQESTDYGEKRRQVASGLVVALLLSPVVVAGGAALAWLLPGWLSAPSSWVLPLRVAVAIVTADVVVTNLLALPRAVLEGENLAYRRLGITVFIILAGGAMTVAAVMLDTGVVGIAAAVLVTSLISLLAYLRIASREVGWFALERPASADVRRFFGLGAWFMAWSLVNQGVRNSDVVVLGVVASAALVTDYTLTSYLPATIGAVVLVGLTGVTPGLGGLIGAGHFDKVRDLRHELSRLTWIITLPAATVVVLLNRSFLGLWVGERFYPGALEASLIVVLALQLIYLRNDANIIDLTLDL
ncbi:MAG: oligosaccharide flippase family protein, partial [Acidimicrobiia bacterium]